VKNGYSGNLCGFERKSTMEQVQENIASTDHSGVGKFNQDNLTLINRAMEAYKNL
jgi:hypothetical protein